MAIVARSLTDSWAIGEVAIPSRIVLAPMAGFSVQAFRRQGRRFGAGLVCSEMVSAAGLGHGSERTHGYLRVASDEQPLAIQIFGAEPRQMAEAARMVVAAGADLVDINMGCPVRKVTKTGAGCTLLERDGGDDAVRVVAAVADAVDVPVLVKMRRGERDGSRTCLTVGPRFVAAGARCLTLHPRSAQQMYTGIADHSLTAELADLVDVPVIASGDITSRARAEAVLHTTGAAAVMIARGAQGNPWLLRELSDGDAADVDDIEVIAELVCFTREVVREIGADRAVHFMRKFHSQYLKRTSLPKTVRGELNAIGSVEEVEDHLFALVPGAAERAAALEVEPGVRRPGDDDRELALPVSLFGGG